MTLLHSLTTPYNMKLIRHLVLDQCSTLISLRSAPHLCYINTHFCLTFIPQVHTIQHTIAFRLCESRKWIVMLQSSQVFSKELQRIWEEGEYGACITSPVAACTEFSSFRPCYAILGSVGRNACIYIHLYWNACVTVIYLSVPAGVLHTWCERMGFGRVACGPELKLCCVQLLSAADRHADRLS